MCVMSRRGLHDHCRLGWPQGRRILIGKVYGHLANEHRKAMAEKLSFEPVIVAQAANQ